MIKYSAVTLLALSACASSDAQPAPSSGTVLSPVEQCSDALRAHTSVDWTSFAVLPDTPNEDVSDLLDARNAIAKGLEESIGCSANIIELEGGACAFVGGYYGSDVVCKLTDKNLGYFTVSGDNIQGVVITWTRFD